ncbi:hypothetical protein, partial [Escherichia coli]
AAVAAGRFEFAPLITPPSDAQRRKTGSFLNLWLNRFERLPDAPLSTSQRMDRTMLLAKLRSDLWRLDVLK